MAGAELSGRAPASHVQSPGFHPQQTEVRGRKKENEKEPEEKEEERGKLFLRCHPSGDKFCAGKMFVCFVCCSD